MVPELKYREADHHNWFSDQAGTTQGGFQGPIGI